MDDSGRLAGTMRVSEKLKASAPVAVGDWVLREACAAGMRLAEAGIEDIVMSVNIAPPQAATYIWELLAE